MTRISILASLMVLTVVSTADAQLMEPPPRTTRPRLGSTRPTERDETTHTLAFRVDLLAGYNRNHVPSNSPQAQNLILRPSSYTGSGDATLQYAVGNSRRGLDVSGGGRANGYSNVGGNPGPVYGGDISASARTPLGGGTTLTVSQNANLSPYMALGLFDGLQTAANVAYDPEGNVLNGLLEGNIWSMNTGVAVGHSWASRTTTAVRYGYQTRDHQRGGNDLSQKDHSAAFDVAQQFGQTVGIRASYRVANRRAQQVGLQRHDLTHGITGGFEMGQQISRTRTLSMAVGGGAELIDSFDSAASRYWQPSWYSSLGIDIGRSWAVTANYQQTSSVVHSIVSAPDSYLMQSAVVSTGGNAGSNVELVFNAGYSSGKVSAVRSITGARGDFNGFTSGAQMRTLLAGGWSAVVSVNHYQSQLSGAASQFLQTSGEFERTSFRVGFSWSTQLIDSSRSRATPRRRS